MSLKGYSQETIEFFMGFFGDGNQLKFNRLEDNHLEYCKYADIQPWIEGLKHKADFVILPRLLTTKSIQWYAFAFNNRKLRELKEYLDSFIGPTYTDFNGNIYNLDRDDSVEAAVIKYVGNKCFCFRAPEEKIHDVWSSITLLKKTIDKIPLREVKQFTPIGRQLRDFQFALQQGDFRFAENCLNLIEKKSALSFQNLTFLRIKYFALTEQWDQILLLPQLNPILEMRRPVLITQLLIKSLYFTKIFEIEKLGIIENVIENFKLNIRSKYSTLFRTRGKIESLELLKMSVINLCSLESPPKVEYEDLYEIFIKYQFQDEFVVDLFEYLKKIFVEDSVREIYSNAQRAFEDGFVDRSFQLLLGCEPSVKLLRLLLRCALEINTIDSAKITVEFFNNSDVSIVNQVLEVPLFADKWHQLLDEYSLDSKNKDEETIPGNVLDWIKLLNRQDGKWVLASDILEEGIKNWTIKEFLNDPLKVDEFVEQLSVERSEYNNNQFHMSLPYFTEYFEYTGPDHDILKPVYLSLLDNLVYDDYKSTNSLNAIINLISDIFKIGFSEKEYNELLNNLIDLWSEVQSFNSLTWALDILDILISNNCSDTTLRSSFLSSIISMFSSFSRKITIDQWELLRVLSADMNELEIIEPIYPKKFESEEALKSVQTVKIAAINNLGIYSLESTVLKRVKNLIESKFPSISINVNSDKVATDSLATLAKNSDILLFAWKSAKHAAFDCIMDNKGVNTKILQPSGKGSASMLREFFNYINN